MSHGLLEALLVAIKGVSAMCYGLRGGTWQDPQPFWNVKCHYCHITLKWQGPQHFWNVKCHNCHITLKWQDPQQFWNVKCHHWHNIKIALKWQDPQQFWNVKCHNRQNIKVLKYLSSFYAKCQITLKCAAALALAI